ncbi:hypothetical protein Btru_038257 [Bulinus truncatus]|nr:hypothetical protein Btru_038257 [Bulinus truncatus]
MSGSTPEVFELKCAVQQYAWGKLGKDSVVAKLKSSVDPDFQIDPDATYAELWMGTHPNGPSIVSIPGQEEIPLSKWVEQHQEQLGPEVKSYFKGNLPFLFKVLSVRTSLSIQAHPNKVQAELLHKTRPDLYKDPNHKPEMAIALSPFTGLCGFRPIKEVAHFLQTVDEFREAVGDKACKLITASHSMDMPLHREAMKDAFMSLMNRDSKAVNHALLSLVERVKNLKETSGDIKPFEGDILLKLYSEFPGDRGCFAIYFLNIVHLEPGEAMFLEANLPHAYLSGGSVFSFPLKSCSMDNKEVVFVIDCCHEVREQIDFIKQTVEYLRYNRNWTSLNVSYMTYTDKKPTSLEVLSANISETASEISNHCNALGQEGIFVTVIKKRDLPSMRHCSMRRTHDMNIARNLHLLQCQTLCVGFPSA